MDDPLLLASTWATGLARLLSKLKKKKITADSPSRFGGIKTLSSGTEARTCNLSTLRKSSPRQKTTTLFTSGNPRRKKRRKSAIRDSTNSQLTRSNWKSRSKFGSCLLTVTVLHTIAPRRIKFSKTRGRFLKPNLFRIRQNQGVAVAEYWKPWH